MKWREERGKVRERRIDDKGGSGECADRAMGSGAVTGGRRSRGGRVSEEGG